MFLKDIWSQGLPFRSFKNNLGKPSFTSEMNDGPANTVRINLGGEKLADLEKTLREYKKYFFRLMN